MILGLIEHDRGELNKASLEMLTLARGLASQLNVTLEAVLIGQVARPLAGSLGAYGVAVTHLVQHERLDDYAPEAWAQCLKQLMASLQPAAVLASGTDRGNEVLAHLAAITDQPLAANCIEVQASDPFQVTRQRWGGSLLEEAYLHGQSKLLTVAPLVIPAEEVAAPAAENVISEFKPTLDESAFRVRVTSRSSSAEEGISLAESRIVIGGGRGVGSAEGFAVLSELAELLEGAVGSSRAATNLGWRAHSDQIGQTGTRIAPDLYIACGISGAIQHMVGCKGSKRILAINTDPEAPIMGKADYAIIGDLHEVVPALVAEIEKDSGG
jgi:electron transfer flavoprotein alpha subunit